MHVNDRGFAKQGIYIITSKYANLLGNIQIHRFCKFPITYIFILLYMKGAIETKWNGTQCELEK